MNRIEEHKGCEFCRAIYTKGDWAESGAHDFRLHEGVLYYYDERFGWEGIKVKYCPMCGFQLSAPSAAQDTPTL